MIPVTKQYHDWGWEADLILKWDYSMTVLWKILFWGEGYGNGSRADERCNMMIGGLNSLIPYLGSAVFSKYDRYHYTDAYFKDFLRPQEVDTKQRNL